MNSSSSSAFTSDDVERVVNEFYSSNATSPLNISNSHQNSSFKEKNDERNAWLIKAQNSESAWSFLWPMLSTSKSTHVQFFGANCLVMKLTHLDETSKAVEINEEAFSTIRRQLFSVIEFYIKNDGLKIVLTRLGVALSQMAIRGVSMQYWSHPIPDIISYFKQLMNSNPELVEKILFFLVETLRLISEECNSSSMTSKKKALVRAELMKSSNNVLEIIQYVWSSDSLSNQSKFSTDEIHIQSLKCFGSWVSIGSIEVDSLENIFYYFISKLNLSQYELFETILESLGAVLSNPDLERHVSTLKRLISKCVELDTLVFNQMMDNKLYDEIIPVVEFFVSIGETHAQLLVDWCAQDEGKIVTKRILDILMRVTLVSEQYPIDESISQLATGFWFTFLESTQQTSNDQHRVQCESMFLPIYTQLIEGFSRKCQFSTSIDVNWSDENKESMNTYRTDIADSILNIFFVHKDQVLQIMISTLKRSIDESNGNWNDKWPTLEASLFIWSALVTSFVDVEEGEKTSAKSNNFVNTFLQLIVQVCHNNNIRVTSSLMDCIGGLSPLLNDSMYTNVVGQFISLVLQCIKVNELASSATMALKDLTENCGHSVLQPYSQTILNECVPVLSQNNNNSSSFFLKLDSLKQMTFAIGKILAFLPDDQILPNLEKLLMKHIMTLNELNQRSQNLTQFECDQVISIFSIFSNLYQSIDMSAQRRLSSPLLQIFSQIWNQCKTICSNIRFASNTSVMASLWSFVNTSLTSFPPSDSTSSLGSFLDDIVRVYVNFYSNHRNADSLSICKTIFIVYRGKDGTYCEASKYLISSVISNTLSFVQPLIQQNQKSTLSDSSELLSAFFDLFSNLIRKDLTFFNNTVENQIMCFMLECASVCLTLPEVEVFKHASTFITNCVKVSHTNAPNSVVDLAVKSNVHSILRNVLLSVGGQFSSTQSSHLECFVDILLAFNLHHFDAMCQFMNVFVEENGFPSTSIDRDQKHVYAQQILRERSNANILTKIVRQLSLSCAGLSNADVSGVSESWENIESKDRKILAF